MKNMQRFRTPGLTREREAPIVVEIDTSRPNHKAALKIGHQLHILSGNPIRRDYHTFNRGMSQDALSLSG
jgi:hypothetical protein